MGLAHQAIRFNTAEVSLRTIGANATEISVPELFDRFTKFQAKDRKLAQSSIDARYKLLGRMLEKHLDIPANEVGKRQVEKFADVCDDTLTAGTAKARFCLLASCWDWAKDRYHIEENPFWGHNRRFQSDVPYRQPYTCRSTAASHVLANREDYSTSRWLKPWGILLGCSMTTMQRLSIADRSSIP